MNIKKYRTTKIALSGGLFLSVIGIIYATGLFPSSLPSHPTTIGFQTRLANISSVACPAKSFIKGFRADYTPICVSYNAPTSASLWALPTPSGLPSSAPSGEMLGGKFGTYFKNIYNVCSGNWILRGFTSQGQKICVDAQNRTSILANPSPAPLGSSSISYPAKPSVEPTTGGKFQSFFNNMLTSCSTNIQAIQSINSLWVPNCVNIPVDATCGSSNGVNSYVVPTTNLCAKGNPSVVSGSGPWSWTCAGFDTGTNASCSANRIVNCSYTTTGWWACSVSCGGGTQSSTYHITVPAANGGTCDVSEGQIAATQACNLQSCIPTIVCGDSVTWSKSYNGILYLSTYSSWDNGHSKLINTSTMKLFDAEHAHKGLNDFSTVLDFAHYLATSDGWGWDDFKTISSDWSSCNKFKEGNISTKEKVMQYIN